MAKQVPKVAPADTKAVQEIIGRVLTDKKFLQALHRAPARALAPYDLRPATLAYIKEGLRLRAELTRLQQLIDHTFGAEVRGG
jgi:hypothetical protein